MNLLSDLALKAYGESDHAKNTLKHCGLCFCEGYEKGYQKAVELLKVVMEQHEKNHDYISSLEVDETFRKHFWDILV